MANNRRETKEDLTENETSSVQTDLVQIVTTQNEEKESRQSTVSHIEARIMRVVKDHLIDQNEIYKFPIGH